MIRRLSGIIGTFVATICFGQESICPSALPDGDYYLEEAVKWVPYGSDRKLKGEHATVAAILRDGKFVRISGFMVRKARQYLLLFNEGGGLVDFGNWTRGGGSTLMADGRRTYVLLGRGPENVRYTIRPLSEKRIRVNEVTAGRSFILRKIKPTELARQAEWYQFIGQSDCHP